MANSETAARFWLKKAVPIQSSRQQKQFQRGSAATTATLPKWCFCITIAPAFGWLGRNRARSAKKPDNPRTLAQHFSGGGFICATVPLIVVGQLGPRTSGANLLMTSMDSFLRSNRTCQRNTSLGFTQRPCKACSCRIPKAPAIQQPAHSAPPQQRDYDKLRSV
jgi:hypothetical protein